MVCKDCVSNTTKPNVNLGSRCRDCGCVLEAKARTQNGKCPKDKWPL